MNKSETCKWTFDDINGFFETGCGGCWVFEYEFKIDDDHRFCVRCGKEITLIDAPKPVSDDPDA